MKTTAYIEHGSPVPYYYQLKQILRQQIGDGTYKPGDKLPGELEMCRTFEISRTVVRQTLSELEFEGVLYRRKGRGAFVAHRKVPEYLFQNFTGLSEDVAARGGVLQSEVRRLETTPAPNLVAKELNLETDSTVVVLERLRFVNEIPWTLTITYVPHELCPQLLQEDFTDQSLYALLEQKYGLSIHYGRRSVEAVAATPTIAHALGIEENDPILRLRSTAFDEDGNALEYFIAHHRGDLSRFEVNLLRRSSGPADTGNLPSAPNMIAENPSGKDDERSA